MAGNRNKNLKNLVIEVDGKRYKAIPCGSDNCAKCAFAKRCAKGDSKAPMFNDYTLCSDLDCYFREIEERPAKWYIQQFDAKGVCPEETGWVWPQQGFATRKQAHDAMVDEIRRNMDVEMLDSNCDLEDEDCECYTFDNGVYGLYLITLEV